MNDNVEDIRQGFASFASGDLDAVRERFDKDIVWHVPGRSELAGDYRGVDAVIGYFVQLFERSGGTFKAELVECGEIKANLVACLVRLTWDMPAALDARSVILFQRRDGRTTEVWNFAEDQYAMDEASGPVSIVLPSDRAVTQDAPVKA